MGLLRRQWEDLNFARFECGSPPLPETPEVAAERLIEEARAEAWRTEAENEKTRRLLRESGEGRAPDLRPWVTGGLVCPSPGSWTSLTSMGDFLAGATPAPDPLYLEAMRELDEEFQADRP